MELSLAQVQQIIAAQSDTLLAATTVRGWSIDSRTIAPGDLFFALSGDNFNGHDFVSAALKNGAVAAVVRQPIPGETNLLHVGDSLQALQQLAAYARQSWAQPIVAVTGSAGKTSTKDIIAALLSVHFSVGQTIGNFNNHIGLPLSILRLPAAAQVAVLEMGMNHAGEIRDLCRIATPNIGVVTNVGYAHIENFSAIEGVAAAKRELIEALPADGTAILNADDSLVAEFAKSHAGRSISYGFLPNAEVRAVEVSLTAEGSEFTVGDIKFQSRLSGRHGVSNILAGIAVAVSFGIKPSELTSAVAALTPGKMRGERHEWNGVTVINDAYNSNPEAARSMLDVLCRESGVRRIAVLGEMRELGHMSEILHREVGAYAAAAGVDVLVGINGAALFMIDEAVLHGFAPGRALFFERPEAAGKYLKSFVRKGDTILFKGSRGTRLENALATMEAP